MNEEALRPIPGTHSTVYKSQHGHFLSDQEIERRSVLGVNQDRKCIKPGINDEYRYCDIRKRYLYRCSRKDCSRHWRRSAARFWMRYKNTLTDHQHITHVRLTTKIRLTKRERGIERWVKKVLKAYPTAYLLLVVHRGKSNDHWHAILGTDQPPDLEQLRHFWKRHQPGKKLNPWHSSHAMAIPHNNAMRLLRYLIFGRKGNQLPPWRNIKCKSPVSLKS